MPNSHIWNIKHIARQVKYREISQVLGKAITIQGLDTLEVDLINQLPSMLPNNARLQTAERRELALAKYGLIDATFELPTVSLLDTYESGISLLKKVKFFPQKFEPTEDALGIAEIFMELMLEELAQLMIWARIFLDLPDKRQPTLSLESDFFPATFVVRDACLTNISSIWINKHFYF